MDAGSNGGSTMMLDETEALAQWHDMATYINTEYQITELAASVRRWEDAEQRAKALGKYIKTLQVWTELSLPALVRPQVRQQLNIASSETQILLRAILLRPADPPEEIVSEPIPVTKWWHYAPYMLLTLGAWLIVRSVAQ